MSVGALMQHGRGRTPASRPWLEARWCTMVVGALVHTERGRTDGCTTAVGALVHNGHKRAGAQRSRALAA